MGGAQIMVINQLSHAIDAAIDGESVLLVYADIDMLNADRRTALHYGRQMGTDVYIGDAVIAFRLVGEKTFRKYDKWNKLALTFHPEALNV